VLRPRRSLASGGAAVSDSTDRVVVVGGGVVGAACAYYLAKAGRKVTIVDRAGFGDGCSHANCGFVSPSHVLPLTAPGMVWGALKSLFERNSPLKVRAGTVLRNPRWFLAFARRCHERQMLAAGAGIRALLASSRALYDELIAKERLDCGWTTKGLLFVFRSKAGLDHHGEVAHLLRERFDTHARRIEPDELAAMEPSLRPGLAGAWLYERDAHLRPDRLMSELGRVLIGLGVEIRDNCEVKGLIPWDSWMPFGVRTATGDIEARNVVFATGAWTPLLTRELGCRVPIQPGKGYSITFARPAICPSYPMMFEEDRVAITPFQDGIRIGSTMEFAGYDTTLNRGRLGLLTTRASAYLREMPSGAPQEEWWGWRPMTPDSLPIIGRTATYNVLVAAGHNMLGVSMAPATGKLVAELVTGATPHVDPAPYAPDRWGPIPQPFSPLP
jgi:D-amino-acid dehydrogenase